MYVFDSNCISRQIKLFFFGFDIHSYEAYFISIRVLFGLGSWKEGLGKRVLERGSWKEGLGMFC